MEIEGVIRTLLTGLSADLEPVSMPKTASLPVIVYQRISRIQQMTHSGVDNLLQVRLQYDIFAATYTAVKDLAQQMENILNGYSGTPEGVEVTLIQLDNDRDMPFESEVDNYRVSQDYLVQYREDW